MADEVIPHATDKKSSGRDAAAAMRMAFNDADHTLGVNGFIVMAPGRRITRAVTTTTLAGDTEVFSFFQNSTDLLYTIQVIYTDGSRQDLLEVERIA